MTKSKNDGSNNVVLLKKGFPKSHSAQSAPLTIDGFSDHAQRLVDFEAAYQRAQFADDQTATATLGSLKGLGAFKFKNDLKIDESVASVQTLKKQREGG